MTAQAPEDGRKLDAPVEAEAAEAQAEEVEADEVEAEEAKEVEEEEEARAQRSGRSRHGRAGRWRPVERPKMGKAGPRTTAPRRGKMSRRSGGDA